MGTIKASQTSGTTETEKAIHTLLDYCATYPNATLWYKSSGMVLKEHSGASYLSESQPRSRAGDFFYMGGANKDSNRTNGEIMFISTIMRKVMSSTAEA